MDEISSQGLPTGRTKEDTATVDRASRIAELTNELSDLSKSRASSLRTERFLRRLNSGTLSHTEWKRLPQEMRIRYARLHGGRPKRPDELQRESNYRSKRARRNACSKSSRRANRRGK
jgi:hypothetical protein